MKNIFCIIIFVFTHCFVTAAFAAHFHIDKPTKHLQKELITSKIWQAGCPVDLADLRVLTVSYYDLLGRVHHNGKLLMEKSAASHTLALFKQFYLKKFPFSSIDTLIKHKGNIQFAEEKNITYGFICKRDQQNQFTPESLGMVLTINPAFNPELTYKTDNKNTYVEISPKTAILSVNRNLKLHGMSDQVYSILKQNHFVRLTLSDNQVGWKKFIYVHNHQKKPTENIAAKTHQPHITTPIFTYGPLSSEMKANLKKNGSWFDGCPVSLDRLNLLTLSYYGFDNQIHTGALIVLDVIAPYAVAAFKELYIKHYPIEKFDINDMSLHENSAAFNCRNIVGRNNYSIHSYGLAIDINVSRNPYIGAYNIKDNQMIGTLVPASPYSLPYLDRAKKRAGMNEKIVKVMAKHGFTVWGGEWQDTVDYMHFQMPTAVAKHLVLLDVKSARLLIELVIKDPESAKYMSADTKWDYLYIMYPKTFINVLKKYFHLLKSKDESVVINLIYNELAV